MQEFEFNELQVTRAICCVFGVSPHCPIHRLQSGSGLWGKCYSSGFFLKNYRDVFLYNSNFKSFYSGFELFNCNSVVWGRLEFCYINKFCVSLKHIEF